MDRRSFLFGVGAALIAAPAIVRAASLMPIRGIILPIDLGGTFHRSTIESGMPEPTWRRLYYGARDLPFTQYGGHELFSTT